MTHQGETVVDGLHFAECLRWFEGCLYFSDMYGDAVLSFDPKTGAVRTVAEVFHPGGLGWLPDGRMLVVGSEDRQVLEVDGETTATYADLTGLAPGWTNDLLVERSGRAYVGNFGYDLFDDEPRPTELILLQQDRSTSLVGGSVLFPNGMVKRSDGRLVVAETFGHRLAVFAIAADGSLTIETTIPLGDDVFPDGICVDAEDGIWLTSVLSNELIRVAPDGSFDRRKVSRSPFSCVLGGEDRRTLFFATAPDYEPADRRASTEGRIEAIVVDVPGVGVDGLGG